MVTAAVATYDKHSHDSAETRCSALFEREADDAVIFIDIISGTFAIIARRENVGWAYAAFARVSRRRQYAADF